MADASSSSGTFGITKLNGDNYATWRYKMNLLLDKEEVLDNIEKDPPTEASALVEWNKKERRAKQLIGLLVEDNQIKRFRGKTTAKAMWGALDEHYGKANHANRLILFKELSRMTLAEGGNMEEHLDKLQDKMDRLDDYGHNFDDLMTVSFIMGSLPESYDALTNALEGRIDTDLTPTLLKNKLISEYRKRLGRASADAVDSALQVSKQNLECFFCKNKGHSKNECRKFLKWKAKKRL